MLHHIFLTTQDVELMCLLKMDLERSTLRRPVAKPGCREVRLTLCAIAGVSVTFPDSAHNSTAQRVAPSVAPSA